MKQVLFNDEFFSIVYHRRNALSLWNPMITESNPADNMNLRLAKIGERLQGFGIYCLSCDDGVYGDRIIYLGKFAGEINKRLGFDDATGGDVRDRWFKHIGTATLLLANLRMSSRVSFYEHRDKLKKFYAGNDSFMASYSCSFLGLDEKILEEFVFSSGQDLQVSKNRLGFAIQNFTWTNKPFPNSIDELRQVISRFTCHYWQVIPIGRVKKTLIYGLLGGSSKYPGVEFNIINEYKDKLPMNKEYEASKNLIGYYHYNPEYLLRVTGDVESEFGRFSDSIRTELLKLVGPVLRSEI